LTTVEKIAERVAVSHPRAAVMQRDPGRIVRDDAAGAQAGGVGVNAAEVIEPERGVVPSRIVLDERQLRPAHGPLEPGFFWNGAGFAGRGSGRDPDARQRRDDDEVAPRDRSHARCLPTLNQYRQAATKTRKLENTRTKAQIRFVVS